MPIENEIDREIRSLRRRIGRNEGGGRITERSSAGTKNLDNQRKRNLNILLERKARGKRRDAGLSGEEFDFVRSGPPKNPSASGSKLKKRLTGN
tara:strand:- start:132 stop:413 length:282 start_codon:yes stop_codon:yes gene_type:complete